MICHPTLYRAMDAKQLALICRELADARKAENIVVLDMRSLTSVTDYFVICTGGSEPHLRAIVEEITEKLRDDHRVRPRAVDGGPGASWIVLDFLDVMVHVMRTETRDRYSLEELWADAPRLKPRRMVSPRSPGGSTVNRAATSRTAGRGGR